MRILKQLSRKTTSIFLYFLVYLLLSAITVITFSFFFYDHDCSSPLILSLSVFWGLPYTVSNIDFHIILIEKVFNDLFIIAFIGSTLSKLLKPINPIITAENAIYCGKKYTFRYWIMLPRNTYFYNASVRVLLTNEAAFNRGSNKLEALWQYEQQYGMIRGIRYLDIDRSHSLMLKKKIGETKRNNLDWYILIIISGQTAEGVIYSHHAIYKEQSIMENHRFVPTRKSEFSDNDFYQLNIPSPMEKTFTGKDCRRYQYFDKLYKVDINSTSCKRCSSQESRARRRNKRIVLTREQIENGPYCKLLTILTDSLNHIAQHIID